MTCQEASLPTGGTFRTLNSFNTRAEGGLAMSIITICKKMCPAAVYAKDIAVLSTGKGNERQAAKGFQALRFQSYPKSPFLTFRKHFKCAALISSVIRTRVYTFASVRRTCRLTSAAHFFQVTS